MRVRDAEATMLPSLTIRIPYQSPGAGFVAAEVKVIGSATVPTKERLPSTINSVLKTSIPECWSSYKAWARIVVPGSMVRVTPAGTVRSPVRVTTPLQVSSEDKTPLVVGRLLSMVTEMPVPGVSVTSSLSTTRVRRV